MAGEHYTYLINTSIVLGLIGLLVCVYSDIPKPYDGVLLWLLPGLMIFNYLSLDWLSNEKRSVN